MSKMHPFSSLSIRWIGFFSLLCLGASCSSPRLAQTASPSNQYPVVYADEAPQAAQVRTEATDMQEASREVELVASSDPHMLPAVARQLDAALTDLSAQNPILARKVAKMVKKVEQPATTEAVNSSQEAITKNESAARKMLAKAEKKFDIMKAKSANAAQANTALIGLGALLSVVGLVLLLATSGTGATVGLIALIIGVVLLILGLLSGR